MTTGEKLKRKKERLEMYYQAEEKILEGAQSYQLGSRNLTRANLQEVRKTIEKLETEVEDLEKIAEGKKPRRAFAVVPRDF